MHNYAMLKHLQKRKETTVNFYQDRKYMMDTISALLGADELRAVYELVVDGFSFVDQRKKEGIKFEPVVYEPAEEYLSDEQNIPKSVSIYSTDLTYAKQMELLKFLGGDHNYDTFPIITLEDEFD